MNNKAEITAAKGKFVEVIKTPLKCLTSFFGYRPEITREEWEKMESKKVINRKQQQHNWMGGN